MSRHFVIALALVIACSSMLFAQGKGAFAGVKACGTCHEDLVKGWSGTPHAKAFESLKKSSQQNLPDCVKCHVTGFEKVSGFMDIELTPEMAGVQCEQCHGPAKHHAESGGDKTGLVRSSGSAMCIGCHTPGQDKNFDYQQKVKLVHGSGTLAQVTTAGAVAAAKLAIEPMTKSFGVIDEGVPAKMVATVTNTGDRDITITNVRTN